jgi:hypothetical protein
MTTGPTDDAQRGTEPDPVLAVVPDVHVVDGLEEPGVVRLMAPETVGGSSRSRAGWSTGGRSRSNSTGRCVPRELQRRTFATRSRGSRGLAADARERERWRDAQRPHHAVLLATEERERTR